MSKGKIKIMQHIRKKIDAAPRNGYVTVLHLQMIKYHEELEDLTGKEFCEGVGIGISFGTEFSKMRRIAPKLIAAGLDINLID